MKENEAPKITALVRAWEDWDEAEKAAPATEGPKLCKIENPDCEACQ